MTVRTRYAPSPTGDPHVGNIRTAIFAWAMARTNGGKFLLRIEDTDQNRLEPRSVEAIYQSLRWLGIDWDEGPDVGGPHAPYVQSERIELYQTAANRLISEGKAYRCFCTAERLDAVRASQAAAKKPPGYDGLCRAVPAGESERRSQSERFVVRFRMKREGQTVLDDIIRGKVVFENALQDDFVALKSDGFPTYHLALIVDDTEMLITHAIRGEEWISSAPKHLQVYEALGLEPTKFAHLPLIVGPDRKKLSKRSGDTALLDYREKGYLPEAMLNFLVLLGWSLDDKTTIIRRDDLLAHFTLERVVPNPAVFDIERLDYLNGQYIRELHEAEWLKTVETWAVRTLPQDVYDRLEPGVLMAAAPLLRERTATLAAIGPSLEFFAGAEAPEYAVASLAEKIGGDPAVAVPILDAALVALDAISESGWDREAIEAVIRGLEATLGQKLRKFVSVLYVAVEGSAQGLPLFDSMAILGRERSLHRLRVARAKAG
ncbi:MAG: glutamate--tRNA ligase [Dehalococcoidia bacterium]